GYEAPMYPRKVSLSFRPNKSSPVLYVVWNFRSPDGDWEALRVSALPDSPSSWIVVRGGRVVEQHPVATTADAGERAWEFTFLMGRIQGWENGEPVLDMQFEQRTPTVHFALAPAWVFRFLRPPWSAVTRVRVDYVERDGDAVSDSTAPRWWWTLLGLAAGFATLRVVFAVDRRVGRFLLARGPFARVMSGYPLLTVVVPFGLWLFFAVWEADKRVDGGLHWYKPYLQDGVFDEAAFRVDPVLRRGKHEIRVPLDGETVVIAAHGGSTTDGYPYERGRWDWPTRLGETIAADPDYASRAVQVLNLSYVSDVLENNFPPGIEGFYRVVRPRVSVIHTVVNNYYSYRPTEAVAHGFGIWSHRYHHAATETGDDPLKRFLVLLREKIRLCRKAGTWPLIVIPALDPDAFDRDPPMDDWSEATIAAAREDGAGVVDLRPAFRARAGSGDILFQEFMHPNRAGYDLVADEIWRVMRENRDRWWPLDSH
ncbi:MAG: hypothetical protein KJ042_00160, partial [Deltaproteobacteria bacterium]|nr:hypothetical protein [Deltaproteobacteria bacterium]